MSYGGPCQVNFIKIMLYVVIKYINGRHELSNLAKLFNDRGYGDTVLYNSGGWKDNLKVVQPHLMFENESDATAYVLSYGGIISKEIPTD